MSEYRTDDELVVERLPNGSAIYTNVKQGSSVWWKLRTAIPTASEYHKIVTPVDMEYSKAATTYMAELLAEELLGEPLEWGSTDWTERGQIAEPRAISWYEAARDVEVRRVGFVTFENGTEGGSPDGLIGDDGVVECKARSARNHMMCLMGLDEIAKKTQIQGLLRVTGREWCDAVSWHPTIPPVVFRYYRDDRFQAALAEHLATFKADLAKARARLQAIGRAGRIDDGLLAQLQASINAKKKAKGAPTNEEITAFHELFTLAKSKGVLDEKDLAAVAADFQNERWSEVHDMASHCKRAIGLEVV